MESRRIVAYEMLYILGVSHASQPPTGRPMRSFTRAGLPEGKPDEFTVPDNVRSGHGNFNLLTGRRMLSTGLQLHHALLGHHEEARHEEPAIASMVTIGGASNPAC